MKNIIKINPGFNRIEFWAANTIFAFVVFFFIVNGSDEHYFIPQLVRYAAMFLGFLYLNFIVIPKLINRHRLALNSILLILVFILLLAVFFGIDTYLSEYSYILPTGKKDAHGVIFWQSLKYAGIVFAVLAAYTIIKYLSLYLIDISGAIQAKYHFIRREGIVATIVWVIGLLLLVIGEMPGLLIAGWIIAIPTAILLYLLGFYMLIPTSLNKKHPFILYAFKNSLILLLVLMAWGLILKLIVGGDMAHLAALWIFNSVLQMFITIPMTWILYKRHLKGNEQLDVLRKELGQSNASFDFLRSQINPHFLFNALNTLYGTAIQEKAERTSEGIEKLGDMMRFMLRENMQEKILLAREIEYLDNYISLQRLRTDPSPGVQIETKIQARENNFQIAPMLLIPFVENAFKHGISFREPSYIKITLEVKDKTLYFEVYNSRHIRVGSDPERDKSGIGLENVQQRLHLLYPKNHELVIRDDAKEYLIQLILQLG